jgi:hypothetical protein
MSASQIPGPSLSLAYTAPEAAAGAEALTLQVAWRAAIQGFLAPSSRQPRPWAPSLDPTTRQAAEFIQRLSSTRRKIAENVLEKLCAVVGSLPLTELPPVSAVALEDGSVLLEWTFPDRRLGFTLEPKAEASGWYFVFSNGSSERYEAGTMDQLEMPRLVAAMLSKKAP